MERIRGSDHGIVLSRPVGAATAEEAMFVVVVLLALAMAVAGRQC
jgi:hypothetical protein